MFSITNKLILGRAPQVSSISISTSQNLNALWNFGKSKKSEEPSSTTDPKGLQPADFTPGMISRGPLPLITSRDLPFCPPHRPARQAWVENLDTLDEQKLGLVDLHPSIWAKFPRIDVLHKNIVWQTLYRKINWYSCPTRAELPGSGRKPWPQKGSGRARHGSMRSPIWIGGAKAHGPRGPRTYYYELHDHVKVLGLTTALSVKLAQDDVKFVDSLDIPSQEAGYLEELAAKRAWGVSVLFIDDTDLMPLSISLATENIGHLNLMPVYGLNVYSMMKHDTLVLTTAALNLIESKLLHHLHKNDSVAWTKRKPKPNHVDLLRMSRPDGYLPAGEGKAKKYSQT